MNGRIDYSNLQNITKQLKQNISKKYETFEKLTSEISSSGGSSGGSGGGGGGLGELGDLLNIFFSQGTYNGTLKINGGLVVDYIETDDAGEAGDIDKASINKLIDKAIRSNNKRIAGAGGPGGAGSIGSLSGVGISSASIRNSFFSGGTIDGATVENLDGLNNLFKDDYLDMYSIASVRDNFIFYISSAYNDIRFTYDDKERDYYTLSFGQQKDIFTQQDWVLGNQNIANTYINSKVYNVLFQPENLPIGITGLTQTLEEQRAKFKISDMNVEIGKSTTTTANPIMTVNGDLKVMSGGRIFLDTREIKPTGGSGAIFSIPADGITNTGVIKKITIDNGGSGYDPGSANIIFGAPRFATREVFTSEGSQSAPSATVTVVGGVITAVNITGDNSTVYPGPPIVTISSSSGGTGAIVTAEMSANKWQSPAQATITGFVIESGGSGYSDGTTTVSISSSPEVTTAILEQGSLVVVNGVITSVQLPENGIGSFYMRGTNTIIMNTTDTASSQTLTDLFGESISLTNDSLTDLQIKYVAETLNQTTLSSIATNNKNIYESLIIKSGMNIAHNVAIIQNVKFKIKTAENLITHIGPYNTLTINEFVVPEGKGATIKNWFDGFKVFQKTSLGNIELSLLKVTLTDITHDTDSPEQPTLGSAADGDAIGTFNGLIELDIVVTEKMTNAQKLNGYPSSLYSGSNINGNETSGYPIYIGEANTNNSANLKLPVDSSDIPKPIEFFGTYQLYNSATGSLEFITDGVTDFISGNKTFFSGDNNKIIIGYNSANVPTLNNNELLHVNGIIKSTSIENTAIGSNTPSTGNFSALTVTGSSVINGDLTVNGTQTTINSTTLTVDDKNIEMGTVDSPTELTAAGGGIILKGATDKSILWNSENWTSSENFNLQSGKIFKIDNTSVLSADTLGLGVLTSSLTTVGTLDSGSISTNFGNIDNGDSNITCGGVFHIDKDADANDTTADSTSGRISLGINSDLNLYHGGTDSFIVNKIGNLELHTQETSAGFILDAKNGTIEIKEDGTLMTTINNTGINIVSGDEYQINGNSVLSNNTLGTGVVTSSLTTVATLNSGSISSDFGDIDNGDSNITSGGVLHIDKDADANDTTADSTSGRISLGINSDLNLYHGGTDSYIVNKIGNLELHTQAASTGFILDAKNGTIDIKEDGTLMTTINNTGINIVSGDEYQIDGNSVLSNNTLGSGVVTSSLTTVGTLDSGSISSNFGDIDIGANTIKSQDILVTNAGIGVVSASAALDIQDIFADKSSVNTIVKITSTTDDNTANIGFGGRISLNAENGGDASNSGSIQEAATIDYYLKERDVLDTDNTTSDLTADIWGLKFRIKDDEQMVDALTIVGAGGGPDGDNSQPHGANIGIGTNTPTNKLDVNGTFRATGAVTLDTTLDVTGATTLNSTLSITSATTINSTLSISGKYYGDGSELTSLSTNLISNDNSSVDILTKTVGNSISFDGVSTNSVYDERTSSGNIVSYSFRFKMTNATQTAYLFSSPTGTGGTTSNNRYVKIYNSGSSISLSNSNETTDGSGNINGDGTQYFQNDTLHHVVISAQTPFSGPSTTDYKIYVDGVYKFTQSEDASLSSPYTSFQTKFKLGIGHDGNNGHLDGEIQELYIFNSTITNSEATDLYNNILPFSLNNSLVHSLATTSSEFIKFKNESTEIMRITDNKLGIGTISPGHTLDVVGTLRTSGATIINSTLSISGATVIDSTLSLSGKYYGDGSELKDLSTNLIKNDNSSIDVLTQSIGNSISFDGVSTNTIYNERTASGNVVSYSFKFRSSDVTQNMYLFSSPTGTGGTTSNNRYVKIYNSGSSISLSNSNETTDGSGNINGDGSQYFQNDTWHHIVVSAQTPFSGPNNTDYKIYVDGVFKFTQSEDASLSSPYTSFKTKFKLGIGHFGTNEHFDGDMQEIYIFNSTISASQVSELYDSILPFNLNSNIVKELGASNSECIKFKNESAEIMRITDNKLGIGTTSPTEKLHVNGNIIANTVEANLTGNVTGNVTGNLTGDITGDVTGDVTGDLTGNVTGNLLGDVTGNVTGDLIGDVTGNITGSLKGDVEEGEWKGKAIASTKLAVSEAIKTLSVIELNAEPGDEINENSDQALGTDATTTTADKAWREQTHNKLKRAEQNVESLRNTVDSLVLAMSQIIKAFE